MCSFGLFCISLVGWIETLGELSQIVRAQILVCDTHHVTFQALRQFQNPFHSVLHYR